MVPQAEGKKGHYVAIGEWNLLGGYSESLGTVDSTEKRCGCGAMTLNLSACRRRASAPRVRRLPEAQRFGARVRAPDAID